MKLRLLIATGLLVVALSPLHTATITVTTTGDSGPGSLRDALANAGDGDVIDFSVTGIILLTSGELLVSNSVDIIGPGPANLAVDGNAASRVFHIAPSNTVAIFSLTITNGAEGFGGFRHSGGGIYNDHSTLTVSNCSVTANSSESWGGGISNYGSDSGGATLALLNSTISDNSAGLGGAVFNHHATLTMVNSALTGNSAFIGGGIYNNHAVVTASNCTVSGNSAIIFPDGIASGGGIFNNGGEFGNATLTIADTALSGNSAFVGGGIFNSAGEVRIQNSTLSGNTATNGGGIYSSRGTAIVRIANSTLSGNAAYFGILGCLGCGGGGIYNDGRSGSVILQIANSTLSGNAAESGGGIFNRGSFATLEVGDTIFTTGEAGGTIFNMASGIINSFGYNLSNDDGGGFLIATGDRINTDPMLGPLQDNGGPTFTHALSCGSPAIDQGKRDTISELASDTDQRGLPRPVDFPAITNAKGGDGSDIGAVEAQVADSTPPVISEVSVDKSILWPPNNKMENVEVNYQMTDNCDSSPVGFLSVASNEPADGNSAADWVVIDPHHVRLRAARAGNGDGRIYTITITCTDGSGNEATQAVNVTVPKSHGK